MSQSEDMDAVNVYMSTTTIQTPAAAKIHDEWRTWYDDLGWFTRNYESETWDHARNLKNNFNLANATTASDYQAAQEVAQRGLTTEELAGGVRRTLASGQYAEPLISTNTKLGLAVVGITLALGVAAKLALGTAKTLKPI
jgi:hypothetical protein